MATCILCYSSLSFLNRPTFGQGKLLDGSEICFKCFSKYGGAGSGFKGMTSSELIAKVNSQSDRKLEIDQKIKSLSLDSFSSIFGKKEFDELHKILNRDEELIDLVTGNYNGRIGILVLSDKRLIFLDKGFVSLKVEDFPLNIVSSIQYETGFGSGTIIIMASGNKAEISNVIKGKVTLFVDKTRELISQHNASKNQPQQVIINHSIDVADQLLKLSDLKEKGILTEAEFELQKQKLLSL